MSRKIETVPVFYLHRYYACRLLGRIGNLVVCWSPQALDGDNRLHKAYRARRYYCTVAVRQGDEGYLRLSTHMLTQWQALRLAIQVAHANVDWAKWLEGQQAGVNTDDSKRVAQMCLNANYAPDDPRAMEIKRVHLLDLIARNPDRRDEYYLQLIELEDFAGM